MEGWARTTHDGLWNQITMKKRLVALDWMRGIVMVLMAVDHASAAFNQGRLVTDSYVLYETGMALPSAQFYTRWITHICAPTFLFLAGTALALSIERRSKSTEHAWGIDRHLLRRGGFIAILDVLLIAWFWYPGSVLLQVLYAIGFSIILMIPLRRLSTRWLLGLGAGYLVFNELLIGLALGSAGNQPTIAGGFFLHGGIFPRLIIIYPVFPWLAIMMLGWVFGRYLVAQREVESSRWSPAKVLLGSGFASLGLFVIVRRMNSYGNMMLFRENDGLIQWLHVSKYPPSFSFAALQLGLMCVVLGLLFKAQNRCGDRIKPGNPLTVFGQTALFFYILHIVILELSARALGMHNNMGLGTTYLATAGVLFILYPCCRWYRSFKAAHPSSWVRYI